MQTSEPVCASTAAHKHAKILTEALTQYAMTPSRLPRRRGKTTRTNRRRYIINDFIRTCGCRLLGAAQACEQCYSGPGDDCFLLHLFTFSACSAAHATSEQCEAAALGISSRVNCIVNPQAVKRQAWLEFTLEPSLSHRHSLALCVRYDTIDKSPACVKMLSC